MATTAASLLSSDLADAMGVLLPSAKALLLYGSVARGTHVLRSDIDVLQLVEHCPRPAVIGRVNVTQYLPSHLRAMAERGSLFVRHLVEDGRVLHDPEGVLVECLAAYRPPESFESLRAELRIAAMAVNGKLTDAEKHLSGLIKLGIYVVRSACYIRAAELGLLTFDIDAVARRLGDPELARSLEVRHRPAQWSLADLASLSILAARYLGEIPASPYRSFEGLTVALADRSSLHSSLFTTALGGEGPAYGHAGLVPP